MPSPKSMESIRIPKRTRHRFRHLKPPSKSPGAPFRLEDFERGEGNAPSTLPSREASPGAIAGSRSGATGPLYLEFIGLPGTGKSTVRELLVAALAMRGIRTAPEPAHPGSQSPAFPSEADTGLSKSGRGLRFVRYIRLHADMWGLAASTYAYTLRHGRVTKNRIRMVRSLLYTLHKIRAGYEVARRRGIDVVIHDQGGAAYLRQLMADGGVDEDRRWQAVIDSGARYLPPGRRVAVVFDLDPAIAVTRIGSRPGTLGRWDRLDPQQALHELAAQRPRLDRLVQSLLRSNSFTDVLRIDAQDLPNPIAEKIEQFVLAQL